MNQEELKQRLVELLEQAKDECEATGDCTFCEGYEIPVGCLFHKYANNLIANGVTIRERGGVG